MGVLIQNPVMEEVRNSDSEDSSASSVPRSVIPANQIGRETSARRGFPVVAVGLC